MSDLTIGSRGQKGLVLTALPLVLSQMAQVANAVVDTAMIGHYGTIELGAVSASVAIWSPLIVLMVGLLYMLTPTVAELVGKSDHESISELYLQGNVVGLGIGIIVGTCLYLARYWIFEALGLDATMISHAQAYIGWVALGLPGFGLFLASRFVIEGMGQVERVTSIVIVGVGANALLNYGLIYGGLGLPAMGAEGCGLATALVSWMMGLLALFTYLKSRFSDHPVFTNVRLSKLSVKELKSFLLQGLPIAFTLVSDYLAFAVIALLIATMGADKISGHNIAFNILTIAWILPIALGMAVTILIAQAKGANDQFRLQTYRRQVGVSALGISFMLSMLIYAFADRIPLAYSKDPIVIMLVQDCLMVLIFLLPFSACTLVFGFVLRGVKDYVSPFLINSVCTWFLGLPLGYVLCFTDWIRSPMGVVGWWFGLFAGMTLAFLLHMLRIRRVFSDPKWLLP